MAKPKMIFKAILMGNSRNLVAQTEQLYGFIKSNLGSADLKGSTILLALKDNEPGISGIQVPTDQVELAWVSDFQVETILKALQTLETGKQTDLYLLPAGALEDDIAVRWAYRMNGSSLVQVRSVESSQRVFEAKKAAYANHVLATFQLTQKPYCISLAKDGAEPETIPTRDTANFKEHDLRYLNANHRINSEWVPDESASDLERARFMVVGGRGLGSAAACRELEKNANIIGADFGVTRPVAMSAWAPLHRLIGVSGAIARPEVCITAAVSGAPAFYAGIARSQKIIAINLDDQAPITKAADVVIVEDYKTIVDALVKIIMKEKSKAIK